MLARGLGTAGKLLGSRVEASLPSVFHVKEGPEVLTGI